jgi:hypothetical protein
MKLSERTIKKIESLSISEGDKELRVNDFSITLDKVLTDHFLIKIASEHTEKLHGEPTEDNIEVWNDELVTYHKTIKEIIRKLF